MGHWWSKAVPWAVAFVLIAAPPGRAAGLLEDQVDLSGVVQLGCTDPDTCQTHSTNTSVELYSDDVDTFTARLGFNVNASAEFGIGGGEAVEVGLASYTVGFTVRSGGAYQLRVRVRRVGALRRSISTLFCTGAVDLADMSAPTAVFNGDPPAEVPQLALPGATIGSGLFNYDQAVPDVAAERVFSRTGQHGPDRYSFNFSMLAVADSNPCNVSARLGAANGTTEGCPACEYPGDPSREITDDGLFVEVTVLNHCGNGVAEQPEQCDLGNQNGPTSCCNSDCTFRDADLFCRGQNGDCDETDTCSGTSGECPDHKQPAGHSCSDDGDACTTDQCDAVGNCVHTLNPVLCPSQLCGNAQLDAGEQCDLGAANGGVANCCGVDCKFKQQGQACRPSADPCDPADSCSGISFGCPEVELPEDTPCPDDGDFCTEDRCNDGGRCLHTLKPELCPNLFCGNGQLDGSEECDLGDLLNGQPTSCCTADCKQKPDNSSCNDGVFCNLNDRCTNAVCAGSAGDPCVAQASCAVCDEANDRCDTSACAALCGNGQVDGIEECDLGKLDNGESTNCCGTDCKYRPDNSACTDQLFCNGAEHCTAGVCGGAEGSPCVRACELCDEANNACDNSACPAPRLPAQPTRELLIGEIFDGDGDRFDSSAGGLVRGTLDLDANADLRFTAADLLRLPRCGDDAVLVGGVCIDKYEESVFQNPPGSSSFGDHFGGSGDDYPCRDDGSDCAHRIFARSVPGTKPSAYITWFQAQQACASVGKRLPTNAEWQMAVAGTPDTGFDDDGSTTCNTSSGSDLLPARSRSACVSKWGIYDMVGNAWEWVAEWMPASSACPGWGAFSDDAMCLAGARQTANGPAALMRGASAGDGNAAGPFAIYGGFFPSASNSSIGFRCARAPF